jgi:hypothetical protein
MWQTCHSRVVKRLSQVQIRPRSTRIAALAAGLALAALAACQYRTGFNEFPGLRSATWYSYAGAEDIRSRCTPGHDVYRVLYNGNWQEQVRTYDFGPSATGSGGVMDQRVFAGGAGLTFSTEISIPLSGDPFEQMRSVDAQTRLSESDYRALIAALAADGLGQPGPANAALGSWQFWWAAASCVNGTFAYNAWVYPTERFAALHFPALLLSHDQTGVPVNQPRRTDAQTPAPRRGREPYHSDFTIQLDGNGQPIRLPSF